MIQVRVLMTYDEPRSYREAIALALAASLPHAEVFCLSPRVPCPSADAFGVGYHRQIR